MDSLQIQHSPDGFKLETGTELYLISDQDIAHLKRGYTIPLRDTERKSLGPGGIAYTRKGNTEIRLPSGEVVTIPARLMNAADSIRRVILTPASCEAVTS
ncbi:MAG: hypothetical protein BWY45_03224 [Euryarchaeota archaeon ADurb.Bin294]|jgi:hypothetical protein|nr:MAG: hypothetical protein BWY45_03224 [Euryarchaeota archaeon ADurb.Bin294]